MLAPATNAASVRRIRRPPRIEPSRKQFVDKATGASNIADAFTGQVERALVGVYHIPE
jgi:hypothetical protein